MKKKKYAKVLCVYITFASRLNVTLQCADSNEAAEVFYIITES